MKKSNLIAKLSAVPGDPDIVIVDLIKNIDKADAEDGAANGMYKDFDVEHMNGLKIPAGAPEFIALSYEPKTI